VSQASADHPERFSTRCTDEHFAYQNPLAENLVYPGLILTKQIFHLSKPGQESASDQDLI